MAKKPEEKIAELEAAKARIAARLQAEKSKLKKQDRRDDARRKIIVGSVVLAHAENDPAFRETLQAILEAHTTRPIDREFLGLSKGQNFVLSE